LKYKIDENLPAEYTFILREAGFDADSVADEQLSGADDTEVFRHCQIENRILMTLDLDFANVQHIRRNRIQGLWFFAPHFQDKPTLIALLKRVLPLFPLRSPERQLWIVEQDRIRYRED
jgi:predicted nuclease of predicted toxin-antitoxin system